ncbi:MAG TPA: hypothetical protein VEU27_11250 [Gemmatimonadales bacterium]|nr:hypothetical protein [Gemmatimonadales bacterium]
MLPALLVLRATRLLSVLALAGCAASRSPNLNGPAPDQAIQILAAARTRGSARVTIALAAPAHVTVFRVVPGEAIGLLRAPGDTAPEIASALDAGRHELSLAPVAGAEVAAPKAAGATYFQDATSYESCVAQVMATTANQSMQDRQAALDNPYYWCPDRPAPTAAPTPLPAYVLVVTTSGAPDAAILLRELGDLDLSGPIGILTERVGAIVARSAGAASPAFASATSRW